MKQVLLTPVERPCWVRHENGKSVAMFIGHGRLNIVWATKSQVEDGKYPCGVMNLRDKTEIELSYDCAIQKISEVERAK